MSPLKWIGSTAFVIGQRNIISLDAEYTNFGAAHFKADDYDYSIVNEGIKSTYGSTFNLRLGSEWNLGDAYFRLGAAYYGSPFGFGQPGGSIKKASCGISVPLAFDITFDFAYELSYGKTYTDLLQEKRLSHAAFLLSATSLSITDICIDGGYNNFSYFYKLFRNKFLITPKEYRKEHLSSD